MLSPFLKLTLPRINRESALANDQAIEHLLIFISDADSIFLLCSRIHTADVAWRYQNRLTVSQLDVMVLLTI